MASTICLLPYLAFTKLSFLIQLKNVYKTFWIMAHTIQAHFCLLLINFIYFLLFLMFRTSYGIACFGSL